MSHRSKRTKQQHTTVATISDHSDEHDHMNGNITTSSSIQHQQLNNNTDCAVSNHNHNNNGDDLTQSSTMNTTQSTQSTQRRKRSSDARRLYHSPAADDVIRILLSTDNHLGYLENDSIRGMDSFNTFNEILHIGYDNYVDFVLLGGDLFHENKPSRKTMYHTNSILSKYVFGNNRDVRINVTSDQAVNFVTNNRANINNENVKVQLPIFTIHGNHDDPTGMQLSIRI